MIQKTESITKSGAKMMTDLGTPSTIVAGDSEWPHMKTHFENGIQTTWDSTTLGTLKTCPKKYELAFIHDYVSKGKSIHLEFGELAHKGREHYYHHILFDHMSHDEALKAVIKWASTKLQETPLPPHKQKTEYNLLLFFQTYLDHYLGDPCETYILPDGKPAIELSFKLDLGSYMLAGHIDRVVRYNERLYITDLKTTTGTLNDDYFAQYTPNNQMSLYDFAGSIILPEPPAGLILDAAQILTGGIRLERRIIKRTERQRQEWLTDFNMWMRINENYHLNHYPMNDTACNQYGKCPFRDHHCSLQPSLRQASLDAFFEKRVWNPLENR